MECEVKLDRTELCMIRFLWVYIERKKETIVGLEEEYVIGWM